MRSSPDRHGVTVLIPADPNLAWWLLVVTMVAVILACALSGAPLSNLAIGPRAYAWSVVDAATRRGEAFFWFIWILLSVALIAFVAALVVTYAVIATPYR